MMLEGLVEELEELEDKKKPNMDETEVTNLGDEEDVRETRISAHLRSPPKEELITLLKEYRLCGRFNSINFKHTSRAQNEFVDALATIASMIQHPESTCIDPLEITLREEQAHCTHVKAKPDGQPWYADIKAPESSANQKKTIRRLANGFFLNKEVLYKRTPDLGLLSVSESIITDNGANLNIHLMKDIYD
ncbi:uncharacterized protein LOC132624081 [Lycium barbarum]|uniref:uncharacterized protein LOC132624081 n=1 Tax=Lycium barbarum TaxID=112863 RepID=UPI00293EB13A|nr:uncharacterized protein LOC132624081 [Lycium barbarum]